MTTLCALPTCRLRGRHLPTCGTCPVDCDCHAGPNYPCSVPGGCGSEGCGRAEDCSGCLPRVAEEGLVCDRCADRARSNLAELIRLAPDARLVAQGLVRRGTGGGSGKPASRPPLNVDAVDALDAVQGALTTIARDITETRGLHFVSTAFDGHRVADPLVEAASWLSGQLEWLRHAVGDQGGAVAVDVFREISECAARMRSIVEGPREARFLGPCGATWDIGTLDQPDQTMTCDGDVYGIPGAEKGRCKTCGATVDQADRLKWIDDLRREWLYTATEIADAYEGIKANTISQWASRGLLVSRGKHGNSPLYLVGEVLDLAAGDAARREEARAARARRREGATA